MTTAGLATPSDSGGPAAIILELAVGAVGEMIGYALGASQTNRALCRSVDFHRAQQ